jgi:hypothetical protein
MSVEQSETFKLTWNIDEQQGVTPGKRRTSTCMPGTVDRDTNRPSVLSPGPCTHFAPNPDRRLGTYLEYGYILAAAQ